MKKGSQLLSDTMDVITLSALLREVIAEGREGPPQPVRVEARSDEGCACRLLQPQGYPMATIHPAARLRLEPVATTDREAVA